MSTRKTEPSKWDDHWFSCEIKTQDQIVFIWLCDRCSNGGWIEENLRKMSFELRMKEEDIQESLLRLAEKPERGEPKYYDSTSTVLRQYFNSTASVLPEYYGWVANHIKVQENTNALSVKNTFHKGRLKDLLRFPGIIEIASKYYTGLPSSPQVLQQYFRSTTVVQDKIREGEGSLSKVRGESERGKKPNTLESRTMSNEELKGKHVLYDKVLGCLDLRNVFPYESFVELRVKWPDKDVDWPAVIDWITNLHLCAEPGKGVTNAYPLISSMLSKGKFPMKGNPDINMNPALKEHAEEEGRINRGFENSKITAEECKALHKANDEKHGVVK